jgi:hypothetical protein
MRFDLFGAYRGGQILGGMRLLLVVTEFASRTSGGLESHILHQKIDQESVDILSNKKYIYTVKKKLLFDNSKLVLAENAADKLVVAVLVLNIRFLEPWFIFLTENAADKLVVAVSENKHKVREISFLFKKDRFSKQTFQ